MVAYLIVADSSPPGLKVPEARGLGLAASALGTAGELVGEPCFFEEDLVIFAMILKAFGEETKVGMT